MPGFSVLHYLLEFAQTHVHWVSDAIQPSHPFPSPPTFNLSHHQGLFQWVGSLHQVAKELELQFQHQSFQWISLDIKMLKKKKKKIQERARKVNLHFTERHFIVPDSKSAGQRPQFRSITVFNLNMASKNTGLLWGSISSSVIWMTCIKWSMRSLDAIILSIILFFFNFSKYVLKVNIFSPLLS